MMNIHENCDFSPMKEQIKGQLRKMIDDISAIVDKLDDNDGGCMLSSLEQVQRKFSRVQSAAGAFYLNCYLSPYTSKYNELSTALLHLSERKIGALIVVEREEPLDAIIRHGIPIGAAVSHALLESIFYPGNPLHDGAVWVKGDTIVTASNVLPLSSSSVDKQKFGTRHRAALGLSERSDALVLVVSEETGAASLALDGHVYPVILH
ncbi:sporulation-specific diadenylate cyclase CdaS [Paenibacillus thailandensis]|uniref:Diadenylate cyclase n=1 Tax=Paenibacillus thailandensis TaxID=393250 RepID=A0ABW5QUH3_9BACL